MNFKLVTLERLPEIVKVNHQIFEGMYEWPPYTLDKYKERFANLQPVIFIAEKDGKVVGDSISFEKDGEWYLWILGVLKKYRKQGVASKLLDLNEKYAKENKYKTISVKVYNVSKEMLILLLGRGYKITDVEKHEKVKYNAIILKLFI